MFESHHPLPRVQRYDGLSDDAVNEPLWDTFGSARPLSGSTSTSWTTLDTFAQMGYSSESHNEFEEDYNHPSSSRNNYINHLPFLPQPDHDSLLMSPRVPPPPSNEDDDDYRTESISRTCRATRTLPVLELSHEQYSIPQPTTSMNLDDRARSAQHRHDWDSSSSNRSRESSPANSTNSSTYSYPSSTQSTFKINNATPLPSTAPPPSSSTIRRRLPCTVPGCMRRFTNRYTLAVHVEAHRPKPKLTFPCTMGCVEHFSRAHDRLRHEVSKHGKVCEWICGECKRFFSTRKTLGSHRCPVAVGGTRWVT